MAERTDAVVVGGGLAGLVAAAELADAGRRVTIVEQEGENSLGGQAFWSLGGLFFVDSPEQRRLGIRDSRELALQDWLGSAQFDRLEDFWPRRCAEAYIDFAAGEMRPWLHAQGMRWFPVVGWAERGGALADGHGNSVPRFHLTWGTGPGVVEPFERRVRAHVETGRIALKCRHRVSRIVMANGRAAGVAGEVLSPSTASVDRREKRVAYLGLPSLQAYVLADAESRHVEVWQRDADGFAERELGETDQLVVSCGDRRVSLALDDIYDEVAGLAR